MHLLIAGLLLWAGVHFSIRLLPAPRQRLIDTLGKWPYQGLFSLLMVGAIVLLVQGWRQMGAGQALWFFDWARPISLLLMALAACLFVAANAPTDIKQFLRHPQLLSVVLWSVAHLLVNSDPRSILLFGGLALWAMVEITLINAHTGDWVKPAPVGAGKTAVSAVIGLAVFAALLYGHPWLAGVALI